MGAQVSAIDNAFDPSIVRIEPGQSGVAQEALVLLFCPCEHVEGVVDLPERTEQPRQPAQVLDAGGYLLSPPFVDAHFHMDSTLSYGLPRVNRSGTLLEGIALWGELKPLLTQDALVERALAYCDWAVAKGLLAIRSHVDICDPRLLAVEALLHVREKVKPYLDLQLVAFPQDGALWVRRFIAALQKTPPTQAGTFLSFQAAR